MFSLYFRCSFRFAYTVPFFFAIQDGVLLEVYGEMSSFWDETSRCFRNTVMGSDSLCEGGCRKTKASKTSSEHIGLPNGRARISKLSGENQSPLTVYMKRLLDCEVQPAS